MNRSPIFEQTIRDYLDQIATMDFPILAQRLGVRVDGEDLVIPFFDAPHRVSRHRIVGPSGRRPDHSTGVILCKYLLLCPDHVPPQERWVSFKDFKDAAPFVGAYTETTEKAISRDFSGKADSLAAAATGLGGGPLETDLPYTLCLQVPCLPRVPLFVLFDDVDDEFPARCSVLFEKRAEHYLDMECLAMAGMLLASHLREATG